MFPGCLWVSLALFMKAANSHGRGRSTFIDQSSSNHLKSRLRKGGDSDRLSVWVKGILEYGVEQNRGEVTERQRESLGGYQALEATDLHPKQDKPSVTLCGALREACDYLAGLDPSSVSARHAFLS